eukprot:jgi/Bigna1/81799/fgenesh1_pg.84_\
MQSCAQPASIETFGPGQKFGPQNPAHSVEKPYTNLDVKKNKVEYDKKDSELLREPVHSEIYNDEISITKSAINILKHHGSYQQQNRDLRANREEMEKSYQFMLRLKRYIGIKRTTASIKVPCGITTPDVYRLHGVKKGQLKHVIKTIREAGQCNDFPSAFRDSRIPKHEKVTYASIIAEVLAPQSDAFSQIWLDGEKQATIEYWNRYVDVVVMRRGMRYSCLHCVGVDIAAMAKYDNGLGVMTGHKDEPLYGKTYLPRKFKIAVTVEGDNSLDLYINDVGLVVLMEVIKL